MEGFQLSHLQGLHLSLPLAALLIKCAPHRKLADLPTHEVVRENLDTVRNKLMWTASTGKSLSQEDRLLNS